MLDVSQVRADLIERLVGLPHAIGKAEGAVLHRAAQVETAENRLRDTEAALLLAPDRIVGKNVEVREAELRAATATERIAVACDQALSRLLAPAV